MKLPKFIKKPIAKLKRAVNRTPTKTGKRSNTVVNKYIQGSPLRRFEIASGIEGRSWKIDDRIIDSKVSENSKVRARERLKRIVRKKLDKSYAAAAPPHRQKRLATQIELRHRKNKREDRILGEITAFANSQKPVDFGSKKHQ